MSQPNPAAGSGDDPSLSAVDTSQLFDEFQSVSRETWEQKIRKDLKLESDEQLAKKTVWRTREGFDVWPFYDAADLAGVALAAGEPGRFPFLRGPKSDDNHWEIREEVYDADPAVANRRALAALEAGVDSVCFVMTPEGGGLRGVDLGADPAMGFQKLLAGVWLDAAAIHFRAGSAAPLVLALLHGEVLRQKLDPAKIKGTIDFDPMQDLAREGRLDQNRAFKTAAALLDFTREYLPGIRPLAISDRAMHNAGAGIVETLALTLAAGNELLSGLLATDGELKGAAQADAQAICRGLAFDVSISSNYFMEIARLRAARLLWSRILLEYGLNADASANSAAMYIHGRTSEWNQTVYDPHVNLLRATTETMSAALGACDAFTVLPFDLARSPDATDEFGARMARNTQQVIKHEAYLDKVVDPAAGSYYLENLTDSIAREAWQFFQEIEAAGGYRKALANQGAVKAAQTSSPDSGPAQTGLIQARVKASAAKVRAAVASRKQTVLGTNQYPNGQERARETIQNESPAAASRRLPEASGAAGFPAAGDAVGTFREWISALPAQALQHGVGAVIADLFGRADLHVEALRPFRAADDFERLRLATEAHAAAGKATPKVYLAGYGDLAMRKARSMFAANFFACAGYEIIEGPGFENAAEAGEAALKSGAAVVVFCSSDAEYDQAVAATKSVRATGGSQGTPPLVVVAGNPAGHVEALQAAGVQRLIHARSNVLEELQAFHKELGI